jgi:class 3 adenylate cyclase
MIADARDAQRHVRELRLFLEELCGDLCRFDHMQQTGCAPQQVRITQEVFLGQPGLFADLRIEPRGEPHYFVEVKFGYPPERIVAHLIRKYGANAPGVTGATKVILVLDACRVKTCAEIRQQIEARLPAGLRLDIWDEATLVAKVREHFGCVVNLIAEDNIAELKDAVDAAKGRYAFGDEWTGSNLQSSLLWHYSHWHLHDLRIHHGLASRAILPPGMYREVVALIADLSSFSSYVRDTSDDDVTRHCLTSFYSKARHAVHGTGGMMYQFVGDEVIALYGLHGKDGDYLSAALECARSMTDIGNSISNEWQRHIDRVQTSQGVHMGMAIGDVQIVSLRPFGRAHLGAVSDSINIAARFLAFAESDELVVCNALYQALDESVQARFSATEPIEAHNMGRIRAWKTRFR